MRKLKKFAAVLALGLTAVSLAGCGNSKDTAKKDYDFYIFNGKSENAEALKQVVQKYEEEKGVTIKLFSIGDTTVTETLRSEMNSSEKPTIFSIGTGAAQEWKEGGFVKDLEKEALVPELKELAGSIPKEMRLMVEDGDNLGIPYNIEGYGLIVNKQMICDLFGLENADDFIKDYKKADYTQFQTMVKAIDSFLKGTSAESIQLGDNTYTLAVEKTELTQNLNGVFSIAGAEKWTYGDHYSNYALNTVFSNLTDARNATPEQLDSLQEPLRKSIEELDFISQYAAGPDAALKRGPDFVNSTKAGYDQAVQTFTEKRAVFIKQGNWVFSNVAKLDQDYANQLTMLPLKVNFEAADIKVEGRNPEKFNQSIPEFVPNYYAVNKKVGEEEQKKAEEFLLWLNTSEEGQKCIVEDFAFVPFNASADTVLDNPLSTDLISYMKEGNVLGNPFNGVPNAWGQEVYGKYIMENLFTKETWTPEDYETVAKDSIAQWKSFQEE